MTKFKKLIRRQSWCQSAQNLCLLAIGEKICEILVDESMFERISLSKGLESSHHIILSYTKDNVESNVECFTKNEAYDTNWVIVVRYREDVASTDSRAHMTYVDEITIDKFELESFVNLDRNTERVLEGYDSIYDGLNIEHTADYFKNYPEFIIRMKDALPKMTLAFEPQKRARTADVTIAGIPDPLNPNNMIHPITGDSVPIESYVPPGREMTAPLWVEDPLMPPMPPLGGSNRNMRGRGVRPRITGDPRHGMFGTGPIPPDDYGPHWAAGTRPDHNWM